MTPYIAIDGNIRKSGTPRSTAIDGRATLATASASAKCIEEIFGWSKTTGGLAQVRLRGSAKVKALITFGLAATT